MDDFVDITLALADRAGNTLVNVGAGEEFSIRHFARLICDRVGYDFDDVQFDSTRYVGAASKCLVVDRLRRYLPDVHLTPVGTGLDRTLDWFKGEGEPLVAAIEGDVRGRVP